jgi:hypothetical protein
MVATQGKKSDAKKKRRAGATEPAPVDRTARGKKAKDTVATQGSPPVARSRGRAKPAPVKVGAGEAARRIRSIADLSEAIDVRGRLRRLARQFERGSGNVQRITFIETAIGECLDEAAACQSARERWLLCEAATWALAWMARTKRAGGSAGGLLERLVREARLSQAALGARDTQPARFVLAVARLFSDIEACRCLEGEAAAALVEEIGRLATTDGCLGLSGSAAMVERVVRWTGAREVAVATGGMPWGEATEERWAASASATLRLLGGQGRILSGAGRLPACYSTPLLDAVGRKTRGVVGGAVRRTARQLERGGRPHGKLLPRALHDAAAAVAVIRTGWERRGVRVLVEYRDATPRLEIAVDDRMLVEGPWQWSASLGGRPLDVEGAWTVSCWESDRKATFLEIVAPLAGGMQIERQVVVLPADRIVLLADAVTPRTAAAAGNGAANGNGAPHVEELRYRGVVPLASALEPERSEETREVCVFDTAMRFMALPLALPEWRVAGRGSFDARPEGLVLEQQGAVRLYAPLWLDCDPARVGGPLTWRQLTVADTRQNLPVHQAAGFRVQAGLEQWLLYRALDVPRNRTLLGCNVSCEFLLGRVKPSGEVARTLEIQ